jgi:hypothetical protein
VIENKNIDVFNDDNIKYWKNQNYNNTISGFNNEKGKF